MARVSKFAPTLEWMPFLMKGGKVFRNEIKGLAGKGLPGK